MKSNEHQQDETENENAKEGDDPQDSKNEMFSASHEAVMGDADDEGDEQDEMHNLALENTD